MPEEQNGILRQSCLLVTDSYLDWFKCTNICLAILTGSKTSSTITSELFARKIDVVVGICDKSNKGRALGLGMARGQRVSMIGCFGVGFCCM
jgi:hypothetical protein